MNIIISFRSYRVPSIPSHERLEAASRQFYLGVLIKRRSKSTAPTYVLIDFDIWRYVVRGKGTESIHKGFWLYSVDDMRCMQLPEHCRALVVRS